MIRRMLVYLRPYMKIMALAFVAMLAVSALTLLAPYLLKVTVDTYITRGDQAGLIRISFGQPPLSSGCMLPPGQSSICSRWWGSACWPTCAATFSSHLQQFSLSYHDTHIVGVTVSRVMNDVATINDLLSQGIITLIGDLLVLVGIIVVMLIMNPRLALLTFTVLPLMVLVTLWFSRRARVAFRETRTSVAKVVGGLAEDIAGVRVIQAFGQEETSQENFSQINEANRQANINAMSLSFIFFPADRVPGDPGDGDRAVVWRAGGGRRDGDAGCAGGFPFLCHPLFPTGAGTEPHVHHAAIRHGRR